MNERSTTMQTPAPFDAFAPTRRLGRTGFMATPLGIGDLADRNVPFDDCVATARRAIDAGLNVIDTAPAYEAGYSEEIVGAAVAHCRDRMFVIDKIDHSDLPVRPQVEQSLHRLNLGSVDAFVFHGVSCMDTWERALAAPGGRMDELAACVVEGLVRFRGISSHHPDVLRAAIVSGFCDLVLFPVGPFVDLRYIDEVLPLARANDVGTVGFKCFGAGKLLGDTSGYNQPLAVRPRGKLSSGGGPSNCPVLPCLSVADCLHYTLTCRPDVALLGLSFPNEQDAAFAASRAFRPISPDALADIRQRAADAIREKGNVWWNP